MAKADERIETFRKRAEGCRLRAAMTNDPALRATFRELAEQWQAMAQQIAEMEAQRPRQA
jgi:hypothetical protein